MLIPAGLLLFLLLSGFFLAWEHSSIIGGSSRSPRQPRFGWQGGGSGRAPHPASLPRYSKAFKVEPSLHAGINAAVLLVAAGHQFETSVQLRQIGGCPPTGWGQGPTGDGDQTLGSVGIAAPRSSSAQVPICWRRGDGLLLPCPGVKLSCLQGRKGSPEELRYYWDVGFCLGAGILANDLSKVIQASEKLYKLNAPGWYGTARHVPTRARLGLQSLVSVLQEGV